MITFPIKKESYLKAKEIIKGNFDVKEKEQATILIGLYESSHKVTKLVNSK